MSDLSYGFGESRSAINCTNQLVQFIKEADQMKDYQVVIFLDIRKAYDNVDMVILERILIFKNFPDKLIKWLICFFQNSGRKNWNNI